MKIVVVDGIRYSVRDTDVRVLGFAKNCFKENLQLPGTILGLPVRSIKPNAFENTDIKSVFLPISLIYVHENAFKGCTKLERVEEYSCTIYPSDVIGWIQFYDYAFADCSALKQVSLKRELSYVTNGVFENCTALERVDALLGKIRKNAFKNCNNLTHLKFGTHPHIANDSIEDSAICCLEFTTEPNLTQNIWRHIKKNNIRIICSMYSALAALAYQGVFVEII